MSSSSASDAAATTAKAAKKALELDRQKYEEGVARQQPFYDAGVNALGQYRTGIAPGGDLTRGFTMADYQADPGYGFRMQEGMKALNQTAAARGGMLSGNALRGAQEYGQNLGSQEYQNAYNRYIGEQGTRRNTLANLAGIGQTTANTMNQAGSMYATNAGNIMQNQALNQANAGLYGAGQQASSYGAAANALGKVNWGNMFGDSGNFYPRTAASGTYPTGSI
jgi:hypothetical protein